MGRRRARERRLRRAEGGGPTAAEAPGTPGASRAPLVGWRERLGGVLASLDAWMQAHAAEAIQAHAEALFGAAEPPAEDRERARLDLAVRPGPGGESFAERYAREAGLDALEREQVARWSRERRRGVFLLQRAERERLLVWDPLEGAPLTLHLPDRLDITWVARLERGTVLTASYQPWFARLVAVGQVEFYGEPKARQLYYEQVVESGRRWHEPPAPAPVRTG